MNSEYDEAEAFGLVQLAEGAGANVSLIVEINGGSLVGTHELTEKTGFSNRGRGILARDVIILGERLT